MFFAVATPALDAVQEWASGPDAQTVALHRGVNVTRLATYEGIARDRVGIRDSGGQAEAYELPPVPREPIDPRLIQAVQRFNDGAATQRILAFIFSHAQFRRVRGRMKAAPSTAEKRLKVLKDKIIAGTETPAELREALVLLIGEVED